MKRIVGVIATVLLISALFVSAGLIVLGDSWNDQQTRIVLEIMAGFFLGSLTSSIVYWKAFPSFSELFDRRFKVIYKKEFAKKEKMILQEEPFGSRVEASFAFIAWETWEDLKEERRAAFRWARLWLGSTPWMGEEEFMHMAAETYRRRAYNDFKFKHPSMNSNIQRVFDGSTD